MAKRRNGTGTVRRRKDGRWEGRLWLGDGKTRSVYGATMREVQDKLRELERQQENGVDLNAKPQTVEQFLSTWLGLVVKENCRSKTYESYEQIVRCHLIPHLGKIRLDALRPDPIRNMREVLREKGLSDRTRQYVVGVLSRALNQAVEDGLIARNVAKQIKASSVKRKEQKILTKKMLARFLAAVRGHRLEALYHLAIRLGLRRGELVALKWDNIDLQHRSLSVIASKTEAGVRKLPLSPRLADMLQQHRACQEEERTLYGDRWQEHGLVFPSLVGTPLSPRNLVRHFKRVLIGLINEDIQKIEEEIGQPFTEEERKKYTKERMIRFHDLRHTCASLLVAQGVHPRVIMEILGQSSIKVAMEIYAHVDLHQKRDALSMLDGVLTNGSSDGDENLLKDSLLDDEPGEDDDDESDDDDDELLVCKD